MPISEHVQIMTQSDNGFNNAISFLELEYEKLNTNFTEIKKINKRLTNNINEYNKHQCLDQYERNTFWRINDGTRSRNILLSTWVRDFQQFELLHEWMSENDHFIEEKNFKELVLKSVKHMNTLFDPVKNYVHDGPVDTWDKPMRFIERNFHGDCDDFATFMNYFIRVQLYHNGLYDEYKNNLYFAIGPTTTYDGWALENHAYNIIEYKDNFYILESTAAAKERNKELFLVPFPLNKYPFPVMMSNEDKNYRQPVLLQKIQL